MWDLWQSTILLRDPYLIQLPCLLVGPYSKVLKASTCLALAFSSVSHA